ncbi:MAG: 2-phospho-L-lactate transferase [Chloroflexi bacterium]|nr:2-phospho-L-lactate transferase [Chloroflexota bacterium]
MPKIVALAGGVGGSKLAFGLYSHLGADLTVVVNTGDDETMFGLRVCPDLDTVRYTVSGLANPQTGWGIEGDTFQALGQLERYGLATWFRLGDRDLATSLARTALLSSGQRLTEVEAALDQALGLTCRMLPMCDEPVATRVTIAGGQELTFQEYFVQRRHEDDVASVEYAGISSARLTNDIRSALESADAVVLCPSNPMVSISPILAVPGLRSQLASLDVPRMAVSPIVGNASVSGPAGQMMAAAGYDVSVLGLARLYADFLTGIVIDETDAGRASELRDLGLTVLTTNTYMKTPDDKRRLAGEILAWLSELTPCAAAAGEGRPALSTAEGVRVLQA